jgi:MoxR-like ATPase
MSDAQRVDAAISRFRAFFEELETAFFERQDVLHQVALALLCREHALLTGPPGTAKSALASAVFGRIVCEDSGEPSMYSRQITESTVQTDLIGPIDFKNLMETGRTAHFTDEGMLGAVHAFLDEVFDGRDMLLRSALNVLQERELKQGTKVTRGRIECALMTTNRYIAEVLENARETLLAFVDRIAFISFVPRGFAHPSNMQRVLERHVAKASSSRLDALLTLQDLDVLQELVEQVHVSEAICEGMGSLVGALHSELNQATRADPTFVPTRYLSTRTAVRSGQVLRAQCVYDRIFGSSDRQMQVLPKDLEVLRLHLILGGPQIEEVATLLAQESDPSERRQLEIVRTEREIFDRCLSRLKKIKVKPLRSAQKKQKKKKGKGKKKDRLAAVRELAASGEVASLMTGVKALVPLAASGDEDAAEARTLLEAAVAAINRIVFRASLEAAAEPGPDWLAAVERLAQLATSVDDHTVSMNSVAEWLRGEAQEMVLTAAHYAAGAREADLTVALGVSGDAASQTETRLDMLVHLAELRMQLHPAGARPPADESRWSSALDVVEKDIAALWDAAFCRQIELLLAAEADVALSDMLGAIAPELAWLDEATDRLAEIRGGASDLKRRAIGGRLSDLVGARMAALEIVDRSSLHSEIETVLKILATFNLDLAIPPKRWLAWCAEAVLRSARQPAAADELHYDGYVELRKDEQRVAVAYTLSEVALRVAPELSATGEAAADMTGIAELLGRLPDELRARVARTDLNRIERAVDYLERWWNELCAGEMSAAARLDAVVRSRFYQVLWDELALARCTLEVRLVERTFPMDTAPAKALAARIESLEERTRSGAHALLRARTDDAWEAALAT